MSPVLRRLQIQPGEAGPFGWSALVLLLANTASFLFNNYGETTFLKRFGVEYLPLITAANAIVTFFLLSLFAGRIGRIRGDRQLVLVLAGYAVLAVGLRLLVPFELKFVYPLIYILKSQFTVLLAFIYWNVANDLFSTRQSKRLFPVITAGGLLGAITGNLATPALAMVLPTDELLPVFSLVTGMAAVCALRLGAYLPVARHESAASRKRTSLTGELRRIRPLLKESALIRILLLLALLPNLVIPILNYQFSFVADMSFGSEKGLIDFFGYFRGIQNGFALLLSLVVGRLYGRFGLAVSLMFHPANYMLVFAGFLLRFDLATAVYGNLSAGILRRAVNTPAHNALYSLLPEQDRVLVRSFLRGTVVRVGILAGSALLWFSNMFMHPRYLAGYGLVFAGLWLGAVWRLKRLYPAIVADLVKQDLPNFHRLGRNFKALFHGPAFSDTLLERLRQAEGEEARWCAEMLTEAGYRRELDQAILGKLPGSDDRTRLILLPFLSEGTGRGILELFLQVRDPGKPRLMLALAQTVRRILADMSAEEERQTFELAELPEVKACFLGWLAHADPNEFDALLDRWLGGDNAERRAACLALAAHGQSRHRDRVCELLERETDASVRALALRALPAICPEETSRQVLESLQHPEPQVRRAAAAILNPAKTDQFRALLRALTDPDQGVRETAVSVLKNTPRDNFPLLLDALADNHPWKREGLQQVVPSLDLQPVDYDRAARARLRLALRARLRRRIVARLPDNTATRLLLEHLEETVQMQTDMALRILAARQPGGELEAAWRGLRSENQRRRQDSLEALESLLDRSMARPLTALLENRDDRLVERIAARNFALATGSEKVEFLRMLDDENWVTRVLVLEALASAYRIAPYRPVIEKLVSSPHPAVAHTARHAILSNEGAHEEDLSCLIERVEHIRRIDLFSELDTTQLSSAAWQSTVRSYADGEQIAGPERPLDSLMLIISGGVIFRRLDTAGHPVEDLHRVKDGDWFGAATLFGMAPKASMGVYAAGETILLAIGREPFIGMVREQSDLGLNVARGLAKVVADVLRQLQNRHHPVQPEEDQVLEGAFCRNEDECSLFERVRLLRRIELFADLGSRPLTAVAMLGQERRLRAGEHLNIFSPENRGLFLVASGELEVARHNAPLLRRGPGEYFGLGALFDLPIDKLEARALSDCHLLRIPPEEFQACVREYPDIILRCCEALTRVQSGLLDQILTEREKLDEN